MKKLKILAVLVAAIMMTSAMHAQYYSASDSESKAERAERESDLYDDGTDAIDEGKWDRAIDKFSEVAEMKGSRADGALYWTAYALKKSGRRAEALKTIDALKKAYPQSSWLNDANALALETRQAGGEHVAPEHVEDEELKIMALNSLLNTDPEKAYPMLEKILKSGTASRKVRQQAMFVLSQSSSPRAQQLIADLARGNGNPELQRDALQYLGVAGGEKNAALLAQIYASTDRRDVKKKILEAFMISGDKTRVYDAARNEKDAELRKDAIRLLGVMSAKSELVSMYGTETSREAKEAIIDGLFIGGAIDRISELAHSEKDPELRADAIQKLGLMGDKTSGTLLALYNDPSPRVKHAVIEALFLQNNAHALIDLSRKEKDREVRHDILEKLSVMNNKEAVDYMLEILNQ
jgi:hypothetical protein